MADTAFATPERSARKIGAGIAEKHLVGGFAGSRRRFWLLVGAFGAGYVVAALIGIRSIVL